jgi:hypothetical protein
MLAVESSPIELLNDGKRFGFSELLEDTRMAESENGVGSEPNKSITIPELPNDAPAWMRSAAALVGLVGAIIAVLGTFAGIVLGIEGLLEKSKTDEEATRLNVVIAQDKSSSDLLIAQLKLISDKNLADVNLLIADKQLKEKGFEDQSQRNQHQEDATREDDRDREGKLQNAIQELTRNQRNAEGVIVVLGSLTQYSHKYDQEIDNAFISKLAAPHSPTESESIFRAARYLSPDARVELLGAANKLARNRFEQSLLSLYRYFLDDQLTEKSASILDVISKADSQGAKNQIPRLISRLRQERELAEGQALRQAKLQLNIIGDQPVLSYLAVALASRATPEMDTLIDDLRKTPDLETAQSAFEKIKSKVGSEDTTKERDAETTLRDAWEELALSSELIPGALLDARRSGQLVSNSALHDCILAPQTWPAGNYPNLDLSSTITDFQDLSNAQFDQDTKIGLLGGPWIQDYDRETPMNAHFSNGNDDSSRRLKFERFRAVLPKDIDTVVGVDVAGNR